MLTNTINEILKKRASLARDLEYLKENASEDRTDDRMLQLESIICDDTDSISKDDFDEIDKNLPTTDVDKDAEIQRIMESSNDYISFAEMIGLEDL